MLEAAIGPATNYESTVTITIADDSEKKLLTGSIQYSPAWDPNGKLSPAQFLGEYNLRNMDASIYNQITDKNHHWQDLQINLMKRDTGATVALLPNGQKLS